MNEEDVLEFLYLALERYNFSPSQAVKKLIEVHGENSNKTEAYIKSFKEQIKSEKLPQGSLNWWKEAKTLKFLEEVVNKYEKESHNPKAD